MFNALAHLRFIGVGRAIATVSWFFISVIAAVTFPTESIR